MNVIKIERIIDLVDGTNYSVPCGIVEMKEDICNTVIRHK